MGWTEMSTDPNGITSVEYSSPELYLNQWHVTTFGNLIINFLSHEKEKSLPWLLQATAEYTKAKNITGTKAEGAEGI